MGPRTVALLAFVALAPAAAQASDLALSRTIYLVRDGIELRPGPDDSRTNTSSLIRHAVDVPPWETSDQTWADTVACVRRAYAPFAVTVTDEDPGEAPHITAVFGGSPTLLGLPRSYAGASPFTSDCAVIEHSIVFAFTDILRPEARSVCNVIVQEIAHSYGLDHELLENDPMTAKHTTTERAFVDQDVACGEDKPRKCGRGDSACRTVQNSYALLADRIGLADIAPPPPQDAPDDASSNGCAATSGARAGSIAALLVVCWRRRRRMR